MNNKEVAASIQNLVAENQTRQAAEFLCDHLKTGDAAERRSALGLLGRVKKLEDQVAKNIISRTDADLEASKINDSLLYLADELAAGRRAAPPDSPVFSWEKMRWPVLGIGLVVLATLAALPYFRASTFDLIVNVKGPNGNTDPIEGQVKARFGDKYVTNEKPLDKNGRVVFEKNLAEYLDDTVTLIPVDMKYRVASQTAYTAAQQNIITYTLVAVPDTAMLWGVVLDMDKKPAANAKLSLELDGNYISAATDDMGKFQILVPNRKDGDSAPLKIEFGGKYRFNKQVTFSRTTPLAISLNPK